MSPKADRSAPADRSALRRRAVIIVLLVLIVIGVAVGEKLLGEVKRGSPVAAAFTRVGGPTRVETAIDASRFWSSPPTCFVTIPANADPEITLSAARFAMVHDAPLLYVPRNLKRRQRVHTTIDNWRAETGDSSDPVRITARSLGNARACGAKTHPVKVGRLSTLPASKELLPHLLPLRPQSTLDSVVVFAVARRPGYPPDVAVGLALAAHMAREYPAVSLVVLPRYLEADRALENQLRDQRKLVQGGVVLGSAGILTEDTHALLRQILTSTDQQAVLSQKQTILSSISSSLDSVLPLIGGAAAAGALLVLLVPVVIPPIIEAARRTESPGSSKVQQGNGEPPVSDRRSKRTSDGRPDSPAGTDWLNILRDLGSHDQYVTVWLRSGWQVAGQYNSLGSADGQSGDSGHLPKVIKFSRAKAFRLDDKEYLSVSSVGTQRAVWVSVDDIDFIGVGFQAETLNQANQPPAGGESQPRVSAQLPSAGGTAGTDDG